MCSAIELDTEREGNGAKPCFLASERPMEVQWESQASCTKLYKH
jgi:hypothetical protein